MKKIVLTKQTGTISLIPYDLYSTVKIRYGKKTSYVQFHNDRDGMDNFVKGFKNAANIIGTELEIKHEHKGTEDEGGW